MTPDPYPELLDVEAPDAAPDERPELSEADSRLLEALADAGPPVVTAVEDEPRMTTGRRSPAPRERSPLAPVFREPTA